MKQPENVTISASFAYFSAYVAYAGMTLSSSNAFWRQLRRDRDQLTVIGHKFSIRLFAGSYKQLISGFDRLHSEPTSKGASFRVRSFSLCHSRVCGNPEPPHVRLSLGAAFAGMT